MSSLASPSSPPTTPASLQDQRAMSKAEGETLKQHFSPSRVETEEAAQSLSPQLLHPLPSTGPLSAAQHPPSFSSSTTLSEHSELHHHHQHHHHINNNNNINLNPSSHSPPPPSPFHIYLHPQHQQQQQTSGAQNASQLPYSTYIHHPNGHSELMYHYHGQGESHPSELSHHPSHQSSSADEHDHRAQAHHAPSVMPIPQPSPYYQSYYQQSLPLSPSSAASKEHRYQYHTGAAPSPMAKQRGGSYHPYSVPAQRQHPQQLSASARSPGQYNFTAVAPIKPSSIFTPNAALLPDVRYGGMESSAPNFGRLPNGKIIELYPAMMRTIQACEYCRSRKAKCSGGLPCDRCAKKGVRCEYAQLDKKRKVKTTTSDYDMSSGSNHHSNGLSGMNEGGANSSAKKHGGNSSGNRGNSSILASSRSRAAKKNGRTVKAAVASDYDDPPLHLNPFSGFTPVSLLYNPDPRESCNTGEDLDLLSNPHMVVNQPKVEMDAFATRRGPFSPSSPASHSSGEYYSTGWPNGSTSPPLPHFSASPLEKKFESLSGSEEEPAPASAQDSAFYRRDLFTQTYFF